MLLCGLRATPHAVKAADVSSKVRWCLRMIGPIAYATSASRMISRKAIKCISYCRSIVWAMLLARWEELRRGDRKIASAHRWGFPPSFPVALRRKITLLALRAYVIQRIHIAMKRKSHRPLSRCVVGRLAKSPNVTISEFQNLRLKGHANKLLKSRLSHADLHLRNY